VQGGLSNRETHDAASPADGFHFVQPMLRVLIGGEATAGYLIAKIKVTDGSSLPGLTRQSMRRCSAFGYSAWTTGSACGS
jgi:hypothetical protein